MNTQHSFLQSVRKCLYAGAAMAFSSLTFAPLATADDTDVFLGSTSDTSLSSKPNVLLILDTSGSMDFDLDIDNPTGTSRLKVMKDALVKLLESMNNVNVGLMTFNSAGGPVRYPVRYIDDPVDPESGTNTFTLIRSIEQSSDDAQQNIETVLDPDAVTTNDPQLYISQDVGYASSTTTTFTVSNNADDGRESTSSGSWFSGESSLSTASSDIGLLFRNVNIPAGAVILSAELLLTVETTRTDSTSLNILVEDSENAQPFSGTSDVLASRPKIGQVQSWNPVPAADRFQQITSPNFALLVQEVVSKPGWLSGNNIAVFLERQSGRRQFYSREGTTNSNRWPKLRVTYTTTAVPIKQLTGLRFTDIGIPQGSTITRAYLDFTAASTSNTGLKYTIYGENVADAATFTTATGDISGRPRTGAQVGWTLIEDWIAESSYESPDISNIIQEIVNRADWCGGSDLSLILEPSDLADRLAYSYDGNPLKAPTLHVEYDTSTLAPPQTGCLLSEVTSRVNHGLSDAEQISGGTVVTGSSILDLVNNDGYNQQVGIRFPDVGIPQGSEVVSAHVEFTSYSGDTTTTNLTIRGHKVEDSPSFQGNSNISNRLSQATTASVSWSPGSWGTGGTYSSADITSIVQEIVDQPAWDANNALSLVFTGTGRRRAYSFDGSASRAPRLVVQVKLHLANLPDVSAQTVRQQLIQEVKSMKSVAGTPTVNTYMEGIRYFRGMPVYWGDERGSQLSYDRYSRVSHMGSLTGGTLDQPAGCTSTSLDNVECINEDIDGLPTYVSPIKDACQANYIVLLSDGEQNLYSTGDNIPGLLATAPDPEFGSTCSTANGGAECGLKLAEFARRFDQSSLDGSQTIKTYSIGFAFTSDFLRNMATRGGGLYYEANSSDALTSAFQSIVADILSKPTSFTAPTLTISAFNRLFNSNEVYISIFEPDRTARWSGNVKKYFLCRPGQSGCTVGQLIDANDLPAVSDGYIKATAESDWGGVEDGPDVEVGGSGMQVPAFASRNIYTYTGGTAPSNVALDVDAHKVTVGNTSLTESMLGVAAAERDALIRWIRGEDIDDENGNGITNENRWTFGDPLHSAAVSVNYGKSGTTPVSKLFVGFNDGAFRMINTYNGKEEWSFIPPDLLPMQKTLRANPGGLHQYGMDGSPVAWINDPNGNSIIESSKGDFVKIFIGQRRGGRNYYAFDVTPASPVNSATDVTSVKPTLMWQITGGVTAGYEKLGQTWSAPFRTRIMMLESGSPVVKNVLVFGGGYHEVHDTVFDPGSASPYYGNAIFIADAEDGSLIWSVSDSGATVNVPEMRFAIPSDIRIIDTDGDGATDRFYVGDLGGQVWRVDLTGPLKEGSAANTVVGRLAELSDGATAADQRRFMYRPQVALLNDIEHTETGKSKFTAVAINSGDRENPLATSVHDRVYVLRDYALGKMADEDGNSLADASFATIKHSNMGDLYDATLDITSTGSPDSLKESRGWFFDLKEPDASGFIGEKGITEGAILFSSTKEEPPLYTFNTYTPAQLDTSNTCSVSVGTNRTYFVNLFNANGTTVLDDVRSKQNDAFGIAPSQAIGWQEGQDTVSVGMGSTYDEVPYNLYRGDRLVPIYITE